VTRSGAHLPAEGTLPALTGATTWLNSEPLTQESLRELIHQWPLRKRGHTEQLGPTVWALQCVRGAEGADREGRAAQARKSSLDATRSQLLIRPRRRPHRRSGIVLTTDHLDGGHHVEEIISAEEVSLCVEHEAIEGRADGPHRVQ